MPWFYREHEEIGASRDLAVVGAGLDAEHGFNGLALGRFGVGEDDLVFLPAVFQQPPCQAARHVAGADKTNQGVSRIRGMEGHGRRV